MSNGDRTPQEIISSRLNAGNHPTFLVIASWLALHDCMSCQDGLESIINPADCIGDYDCHSDGNRLFGFDDSEQGINALKTLRGLVGSENIFIHNGEGTYLESDDEFLNSLQLQAAGVVDTADSEKLSKFIANMLPKLYQNKRYNLKR